MPSNDFIFTKEGTELRVMPSAGRLRLLAITLLGGGAVVAALGFVVPPIVTADSSVAAAQATAWSSFPKIAGGLVGLTLWGVFAWSWSQRTTPLRVDGGSGEVRYGKKTLCHSGTVRAVRIVAPTNLSEDKHNWEIEFLLERGARVRVPSPLFCGLSEESAAEIAIATAETLGVEVISRDRPR